jgi:hypothetical protein
MNMDAVKNLLSNDLQILDVSDSAAVVCSSVRLGQEAELVFTEKVYVVMEVKYSVAQFFFRRFWISLKLGLLVCTVLDIP